MILLNRNVSTKSEEIHYASQNNKAKDNKDIKDRL